VPEKEQDEFELIPMSPLRRLEKRIDQLESGSGTDARGFVKEIVDIIRMNQQIVDELAKANDALRIELSKLPGRIDELINDLRELISFIKASATEEMVPTQTNLQPLVEKFDQLIQGNKKIVETNEALLSSIEELQNKFKKPPLPPMLVRRPMPPQQPPQQKPIML
jgi:chromosome segregation ATPase